MFSQVCPETLDGFEKTQQGRFDWLPGKSCFCLTVHTVGLGQSECACFVVNCLYKSAGCSFVQNVVTKHVCPELLEQTVYGLPEIHREAIKSALLVANPGCYPTATQLGFLPLITADVIETSMMIADAKSGVSGAGRSASVVGLMSESGESFKAYGVPGHRHLPEITQELNLQSSSPVSLTFMPHLVPMIRGIHATLYAPLKKTGVDLQRVFEEFYANEPFVDVLPAGAHPDTGDIRGTNRCQLAVHQPQGGRVVTVLSVIDNLVKGASGQAIHNMNIMFGLDEKAGLDQVGLYP